MITGISLPLLSSIFANITQVFITLETFFLRIAMLPDASILARWDQNPHLRRMFIERLIDVAFIVRSIGSTGKQSLFNLCQHLFYNSRITSAIARQHSHL